MGDENPFVVGDRERQGGEAGERMGAESGVGRKAMVRLRLQYSSCGDSFRDELWLCSRSSR